MIESRTRLLDAAELLFIERGFAGCSLRAITAEARVNLAAVNYYFRSKEALIREVLLRRLQPINEERLQLLLAVENAAAGAAVPVQRIVEAFIDPLFSCAHATGDTGQLLRRLVGRVHTEPSPCVQRLLVAECRNVSLRFTAALEKALPDASANDIAVRMRFMVGVLVQTAAGLHSEDTAFSAASEAEVVRQMVMFIAAGLQAPPIARALTSF
ncbi:MAG: TetR family transcriptional regulator [Acidobacteria bacterium]|nr:TetR family transcriptional regulator [Acidobacteriota bacterium]